MTLPATSVNELWDEIAAALDTLKAEIPEIDAVLGTGEVGELRIKGRNVMKGYWNRPEDTAAAFADGFFLTGDRVMLLAKDGPVFVRSALVPSPSRFLKNRF